MYCEMIALLFYHTCHTQLTVFSLSNIYSEYKQLEYSKILNKTSQQLNAFKKITQLSRKLGCLPKHVDICCQIIYQHLFIQSTDISNIIQWLQSQELTCNDLLKLFQYSSSIPTITKLQRKLLKQFFK